MKRDTKANAHKKIINHFQYRGTQELAALLASSKGYIENQNLFSTQMNNEIGKRAF